MKNLPFPTKNIKQPFFVVRRFLSSFLREFVFCFAIRKLFCFIFPCLFVRSSLFKRMFCLFCVSLCYIPKLNSIGFPEVFLAFPPPSTRTTVHRNLFTIYFGSNALSSASSERGRKYLRMWNRFHRHLIFLCLNRDGSES